ncbi:MAG: CHAP domain-containing protein, partial [Candidatus Dormiibacterota bacterium]
PSPSPTAPPSPEVVQLQSKAQALEQQIMALQMQAAPLEAQTVQAGQQAAAAQTQLDTEQVELAAANSQLAKTTGLAQAAEARLQSDRTRLGALIVARYMLTTNGTALTTLLQSKTLLDALDTMVSYQQVTDNMNTLVLDVRANTDKLTELQSQQQYKEQQIAAQAAAVQTLQAQSLQDQARYQQQASRLTGSAATLMHRLEDVLTQLATAEGVQAATLGASGGGAGSIDGALPPFAYGPRVDDFPWGQCTWYVASLRDVTWGGDAWEWLIAAAARGKHEGIIPRVGAIVVFGPGNGYSPLGHVAYVESVLNPTNFIVDEANVDGLGIVDQRLISSLTDVEGFIY